MIGTIDLKINSGFKTPMLAIPTPLLAVPYAAPRLANTRAHAMPMNPKNEAFPAWTVSTVYAIRTPRTIFSKS